MMRKRRRSQSPHRSEDDGDSVSSDYTSSSNTSDDRPPLPKRVDLKAALEKGVVINNNKDVPSGNAVSIVASFLRMLPSHASSFTPLQASFRLTPFLLFHIFRGVAPSTKILMLKPKLIANPFATQGGEGREEGGSASRGSAGLQLPSYADATTAQSSMPPQEHPSMIVSMEKALVEFSTHDAVQKLEQQFHGALLRLADPSGQCVEHTYRMFINPNTLRRPLNAEESKNSIGGTSPNHPVEVEETAGKVYAFKNSSNALVIHSDEMETLLGPPMQRSVMTTPTAPSPSFLMSTTSSPRSNTTTFPNSTSNTSTRMLVGGRVPPQMVQQHAPQLGYHHGAHNNIAVDYNVVNQPSHYNEPSVDPYYHQSNMGAGSNMRSYPPVAGAMPLRYEYNATAMTTTTSSSGGANLQGEYLGQHSNNRYNALHYNTHSPYQQQYNSLPQAASTALLYATRCDERNDHVVSSKPEKWGPSLLASPYNDKEVGKGEDEERNEMDLMPPNVDYEEGKDKDWDRKKGHHHHHHHHHQRHHHQHDDDSNSGLSSCSVQELLSQCIPPPTIAQTTRSGDAVARNSNASMIKVVVGGVPPHLPPRY